MTEKSYVWTHGAGGDATYSPYTAEEFNPYLNFWSVGYTQDFRSNTNENPAVIPGYLDSLEVVPAGNGMFSIVISPGAAVIKNCIYILDKNLSFPIPLPSSGLARRDSIILQYTNDEIRVARKAGIESEEEVFSPALTQNAAVWEVELAQVYITSDTSYIEEKHINDKRLFIYNSYIHNNYGSQIENLLTNGEWLGLSGIASDSADGWITIGTAGTYQYGAATTSSGRSREVQIIPSSSTFETDQWCWVGKSNTYTVGGRLRIQYPPDPEDVSVIVGLKAYTATGEESIRYKEIEFSNKNQSSTVGETFHFTVTFPENNISQLKFYIWCNDELTTIYYNVMYLVPGFHWGYYHQIEEIIPFETARTDAAWSATAKSTGATTINLSASFVTTSRAVRDHVKFVILRLRGRDSGSAAGAPYMNVQGNNTFTEIYGTLELQGIANDIWEETYVIVPINGIYWTTGVAGAQFIINISATGAGTFDATVEIVGIIT